MVLVSARSFFDLVGVIITSIIPTRSKKDLAGKQIN
jgi:hypothetical protein